jgi:ankyrin repeat protein
VRPVWDEIKRITRRDHRDSVAELLEAEGPHADMLAASIVGDLDRIRELAAADRSLVNLINRDGWSALGLAAEYGRLQVVKTLILISAQSSTSPGTRILEVCRYISPRGAGILTWSSY